MRTKTIDVNGKELVLSYDGDCRLYYLDADGELESQYTEDDLQAHCMYAFCAYIYVNGKYIAYVHDDVYDDNSPYEAVKLLKRFGFKLDEAIEVYNEMARAIEKQNRWFYVKADFNCDQLEEEWQRELRAERENNQSPEEFWYNKYKK